MFHDVEDDDDVVFLAATCSRGLWLRVSFFSLWARSSLPLALYLALRFDFMGFRLRRTRIG